MGYPLELQWEVGHCGWLRPAISHLWVMGRCLHVFNLVWAVQDQLLPSHVAWFVLLSWLLYTQLGQHLADSADVIPEVFILK